LEEGTYAVDQVRELRLGIDDQEFDPLRPVFPDDLRLQSPT